MATSGQYDFKLVTSEIILDACEHMGIQIVGEALGADEYKSLLRSLNMMIKAWQAEGIGLWLNQQIAIFPNLNDQSITLGPTGGNTSMRAGVIANTLDVAALTAATTITLANATGIVTGMFIGVQLDSGYLQWTTVNGAPVGNVVTLTAALTGDCAAGNVVYTYTSKMQRPKSLVELRRVDYVSGIEIPLILISRDEYMSLPLKSAVGPPNSAYYDPQTNNGTLYLWPTIDTVQTRLVGTVRVPVQDFSAATDDADFPPEWGEALTYNLAVRGGTKYAIPEITWNRLLAMAATTKDTLMAFDTEDTSLFLTVARY